MSAIEATLACECGGRVIAHSADAGNAITCDCGRTVPVPNLSKLRTLAGKEAYVTNPVDAINKMQRQGINPAGNKCVLCGSDTPVLYRCDATCESTHLKSGGGTEPNDIPHLLFYIFLGWWINLLGLWIAVLHSRRAASRRSEVRGHDVGVTFDIPVCDACVATNGSPTRASVAKEFMQRVPAYKDLLTDYPDLALKVKLAAG